MSEIVKKLQDYVDCGVSDEVSVPVSKAILREAIAALQPGGERERWHIGTMNDGLFIINTKPQPAPVDYPFHDRKDGPTLVIPVSALGSERANEIVTAHNKAVEALLRAPVAVTWQPIETCERPDLSKPRTRILTRKLYRQTGAYHYRITNWVPVDEGYWDGWHQCGEQPEEWCTLELPGALSAALAGEVK